MGAVCAQNAAVEACQAENGWVCQDASSSCPKGFVPRTSVSKQQPVLHRDALEGGEDLSQKMEAESSLAGTPQKETEGTDEERSPVSPDDDLDLAKSHSDPNLLQDLDTSMDGVVKKTSSRHSATASDGTASWAGSAVSETSRGSKEEKKKSSSKKKVKKPASSEPHRTSTSSTASGAAAPAGPATKAICIFDTGSEQKTCTFFKKPPGFAIRFPAMTVSKVTGALAMEMGIQAGWKLLEWGTAEDEMHSLGNGEEKGALRQSYVSMIQQLPREKDQEEGSKAGSPTVGKSLAASAVSIPGKWAYDLEVVVISAKGLRDADWMGSSDPYCVATVQGRGKTTFKTKVLKGTKDPVWNEKSKVQDFHAGDQIFFELFDQDGMGKHDKLGHAAVGWEELQDDSAPLKTTLVLDESGKKENNPATLDVKITVMKRKLEMIAPPTGQNNIYRVFVDIKCARGLRDADSFFGGGGSDPYCVCSVVGTGKSKFKTRTIDNKTDPQWNESGVLPDFHKGDKLLLEVYDKDIGKKDDFLGKCEIAAAKALTGFKETEFKLTDTGMINKKPVEAFVTVAVQTHKRTLQGLAPFHGKQQVKPGSMKYQLEVQILAAEGLRNADWLSSGSDPYCLVTVKGKGTATVKTKTIKNEHSPLWKHTDTINDFYHGDALSIQVKDADRLKHDDLLGQVQLLTEQLIPDGFDGDLKLRNTGWKDPENHPVFVTLSIRVLSRQKAE